MVAWLVDCGTLSRFAASSDSATDIRTIVVSVIPMMSSGRMPRLTVTATFLPAMRAPARTKMPNTPAMRSRRMRPAPYAAENAGAVPLAPMLMARNIAARKGISSMENIGENMASSSRRPVAWGQPEHAPTL